LSVWLRLPVKVAQDQKLYVVDDFAFLSSPKTKLMADFLSKANLVDKKVLILANYKEIPNLVLASRNLQEVKLRLPLNLSVKDLLLADAVVVTPDALQAIEQQFGGAIS
jgi:ribosomal protein L4